MNMSRIALYLSISAAMTATASAGVVLPDNGSGTIDFPAASYVVQPGFPNFFISDGLPPGSTIDITAMLGSFNIINQGPGGSLGGDFQQWNAVLDFDPMLGTGVYLGYSRSVSMIVQGEIHTGPRSPSFTADLFLMQGQLPPGDPDFDLLRITGGTGFGMPSPGHTTLTPAGSDWNVDSFFDITFRIDFVGRPEGAFSGRSGSTTQTTRIWIVPSPAGAAVMLAGGLVGMRRRRTE